VSATSTHPDHLDLGVVAGLFVKADANAVLLVLLHSHRLNLSLVFGRWSLAPLVLLSCIAVDRGLVLPKTKDRRPTTVLSKDCFQSRTPALILNAACHPCTMRVVGHPEHGRKL